MDNMYVIKRNSDGCYVTYSGCSSSYTKNLGKARVFRDYETALGNKCDNESICALIGAFHDLTIRRGY